VRKSSGENEEPAGPGLRPHELSAPGGLLPGAAPFQVHANVCACVSLCVLFRGRWVSCGQGPSGCNGIGGLLRRGREDTGEPGWEQVGRGKMGVQEIWGMMVSWLTERWWKTGKSGERLSPAWVSSSSQVPFEVLARRSWYPGTASPFTWGSIPSVFESPPCSFPAK
jgi:hypothetical protein